MRVIGFAGWSGAGKTTLIVRLIPELNCRGFSVSQSSTPITISTSISRARFYEHPPRAQKKCWSPPPIGSR